MKLSKKGSGFLVGLLTGGVIGSVTALLFAPKPGKELRQDIKEGATKVVEASSHAVDQVSEKIYDVSQKVETHTLQLVQGAKQGAQTVVNGVKGLITRESSETSGEETAQKEANSN